jgi:hypothetical protein
MGKEMRHNNMLAVRTGLGGLPYQEEPWAATNYEESFSEAGGQGG